MKLSNCEKMRVVLGGFLAVIVVGAGSTKADFTFGEPVDLGIVIPFLDEPSDFINCFSADGLEMYIQSGRPGGYGSDDLWVLTRTSADAAWSTPENLGPLVNGPDLEGMASISSDGLTLYFNSDRPGGYGSYDIYVTTRPTRGDPWARAVNAGSTINSAYFDGLPWITQDGRELYFESYRPGRIGQGDIWVAKRQEDDDEWQVPEKLGPLVNSPLLDQPFSISPDGLLLVFSYQYYFSSDTPRPGGYGQCDMWMTKRADLSSPWQVPVNLGPKANGPAGDSDPRISADGRTLYFWSSRSGNWNRYQTPIVPIVDFNGDGIVNSGDVCIMIEHWLMDEPLCDIGPMPWGDGVVDVQDLIVLAEHLFEEIFPPELVAYWKLDETEGNIAQNSISDNHGVLSGNPTWQPNAGQVAGALQFDGVDDYISTDFALNPEDGPFSVFAWIKGGAPGQVFISQDNIANWLMVGEQGELRTDIAEVTHTRSGPEVGLTLISQTIVSDGDWHRVGFVRDWTDRILYVDDIQIARDTVKRLEGSTNALNIGVGADLHPDSFFSGLIDDIRIYNRAVHP